MRSCVIPLLRQIVTGRYIAEALRRKCAAGVNIRGVLGRHHKIRQPGYHPRELVKSRGSTKARQLTGAVGAEIHEQDAVIIRHQGARLIVGPDHGWQHELIVFIAPIGGFSAATGSAARYSLRPSVSSQ